MSCVGNGGHLLSPYEQVKYIITFDVAEGQIVVYLKCVNKKYIHEYIRD